MKANRSITPHFKELKVKDYNWDTLYNFSPITENESYFLLFLNL